MQVRTGIGYDVHQLEAGQKLIIGGVHIPCELGSVGYSDGDGLYHALVDALLGAAALGDIGQLFPSDDPRWENVDSRIFLEKARNLVRDADYTIQNIDSVIILQKPKLRDFLPTMRQNIANILEIDVDSVAVKATTTDHLGFIGESAGYAVQTLATLTLDAA